MKTRKTNSEPLPARAGSVMTDRQILNWIAGRMNSRKGVRITISFQDNRDMGYKKDRISLYGGLGSQDLKGKGDTVRKALSAMIREYSQNTQAHGTAGGGTQPKTH